MQMICSCISSYLLFNTGQVYADTDLHEKRVPLDDLLHSNPALFHQIRQTAEAVVHDRMQASAANFVPSEGPKSKKSKAVHDAVYDAVPVVGEAPASIESARTHGLECRLEPSKSADGSQDPTRPGQDVIRKRLLVSLCMTKFSNSCDGILVYAYVYWYVLF